MIRGGYNAGIIKKINNEREMEQYSILFRTFAHENDKTTKDMATMTATNRSNGRTARVVSARVRLSGRTDKPKSEILTIKEFERRASNGTL